MKTLKTLILVTVLTAFMTTSGIAGDSKSYQKANPSTVYFNPTKSFKILSPEVSKSLKLTRIPTSKPIPLIIGHYWRCITHFGEFETCEPVLVVCTNDQSFCTETP